MVSEQVAAFLRQNKGKAYCDDCIAEKVGLSRRQQAHRVTSALGVTAEFDRQDGECCSCRESPRKVTKAADRRVEYGGSHVAENPINPKKASPQSASAIVNLYCSTCKKRRPHTSTGPASNPALGGKLTQAMTCMTCGTLNDVATGPDGGDFQSNVDADDGT